MNQEEIDEYQASMLTIPEIVVDIESDTISAADTTYTRNNLMDQIYDCKKEEPLTLTEEDMLAINLALEEDEKTEETLKFYQPNDSAAYGRATSFSTKPTKVISSKRFVY